MCCSGYYPREGLVRNRAKVGHSEAKRAQSGVKLVECDAGFGYDETFVSIDLFGGENTGKEEGEKTGGYRLAIVPGPDMKCEPWVIMHHRVMHDGHEGSKRESEIAGED